MSDSWMQLAGGRTFDLLEPRATDVHIDDIASALSKLCRYTGHGDGFYSVAEHSVLCSFAAPEGLELEALLHDAHEAYVGDLSRPMKRALGAMAQIVRPGEVALPSDYSLIERCVDAAVRERFGLQPHMPREVHELDTRITQDERAVLFPDSCATRWSGGGVPREPLGVRLHLWEPRQARLVFLNRYLCLTHAGLPR